MSKRFAKSPYTISKKFLENSKAFIQNFISIFSKKKSLSKIHPKDSQKVPIWFLENFPKCFVFEEISTRNLYLKYVQKIRKKSLYDF